MTLMYFARYVCALLFSLALSPLYAANVLVINTTGKPPLNTPQRNGFMDLVAAEALRRIGYRLETVQLPAERGLTNSNAGVDDGEMSRIAGLERLYPNLIRVPEKIMDWEFNAFTNKSIHINGKWSDLSPYAVAYINGWKILEKNVPDEAEITRVQNPRQLFALLHKERTDFIIYERWGGLNIIQKQKFDEMRIIMPPLAVKDMYIYLHKKHEKLVPQVARALYEMKQDGAYQRIHNQTLAPLTQQYQSGDKL
jgi:polar amino acid transport system substrate-binding protein